MDLSKNIAYGNKVPIVITWSRKLMDVPLSNNDHGVQVSKFQLPVRKHLPTDAQIVVVVC